MTFYENFHLVYCFRVTFLTQYHLAFQNYRNRRRFYFNKSSPKNKNLNCCSLLFCAGNNWLKMVAFFGIFRHFSAFFGIFRYFFPLFVAWNRQENLQCNQLWPKWSIKNLSSWKISKGFFYFSLWGKF